MNPHAGSFTCHLVSTQITENPDPGLEILDFKGLVRPFQSEIHSHVQHIFLLHRNNSNISVYTYN